MASSFTIYSKRKKQDVLLVPFFEDKKAPIPALELPFSWSELLPKEVLADFCGKEEQLCTYYTEEVKEGRILFVGLGDARELSLDIVRTAYAKALRYCKKQKWITVNAFLPEAANFEQQKVALAACEGVRFAIYSFSYKQKQEDKFEEISWIATTDQKKGIEYANVLMNAVQNAQNLINGNSDDIHPDALFEAAKQIAKEHYHCKASLFDEKRIQKEGLHLLYAVGKGSASSRLIFLSYTGNPKSKDHTVLVGKGVTYDTGGLNLKPTGSIETMKCDMGGAATVLGAVKAAAALKLQVNVTAVIPSVTNAIGPESYRPGDVYKSYKGITVEIGNTDAEGRLILADALSYSIKHLHPARIIDVATLTGAVVVALGSVYTGIFSNNDPLAEKLIECGQKVGEKLHRLPMDKEYRKQLKSDIADIKNIGGRSAGSITAAEFLKEFVEDTPWLHMDIAGTSFLSEDAGVFPKGASGICVRTLTEYLKTLESA